MTSAAWDSTHGQRRWVWHAINAFGQHTVEQRRAWHATISFGQHKRSNDVGGGMPSPPLDYTHVRTTRAWYDITALDSTYGRQRRAWHDITSLGLHSWSDDIRCGMTSPPLDSTHDRQRQAWHEITALGQHTQLDDVGRGMLSPPLNSTHGRMTLGVACHLRL